MVLKSFLIKLGITFALSTTGGVGLEDVVDKEYHGLVQEEPTHLYVNTNKEHYIMEKSREEGEKDLYRLTGTNSIEESWAFINYNGKQFWHENGIKETKDRAITEFQLVEKYVGQGDKVSGISFYHFHTIDNQKKFDISQMPSNLDFKFFVYTLDVIDCLDSDLADKVDFKIVVSSGVYTVKIDREIIHNRDEKELESLSKTIYDACLERIKIAAGLSDEFDYSQANRANFAKENKKFAEKFSSDAMKISFKPR